MAKIFTSPATACSGQILCAYVNDTSIIQIIRIPNISNWYFERVVFPGQRLFFEAPAQAELEIYTGLMASALLSDKLRCDRLRVTEPISAS